MAISLFVYRNPPWRRSVYKSIAIVITPVLFFTIDQVSLVRALIQHWQIDAQIPVLADFEDSTELQRWSGQNLSLSEQQVQHGKYAMQVTLTPGTKYSGITLRQFPKNWQGYQYLTLPFYNAEKSALTFCVKITDWQHDTREQSYDNRFNRCYDLLPERWTQIKISLKEIEQDPKNRRLDLSNLSQIGFFTSNLNANHKLYLDYLRLQ